MKTIPTKLTNKDILLQIVKEILSLEVVSEEKISKILCKNPSTTGKILSKSEVIGLFNKFWQDVEINQKDKKRFQELIRMKKIRTLSGVTPVTVLTKPYPCPGNCIYCPNDPKMPKSYLSSEPGAQRAYSNNFDPYLQVYNRLVAYKNIGHPTDKVELIVLGGTWSYYSKDYQIWFIKRCFDAMNDFKTNSTRTTFKITKYKKITWGDLLKSQKKNEVAKSRCVGLVLETRPDYIDKKEVIRLRKLGVTKIQIGIQSLNDKILKLNNRGHNVNTTSIAINLLRQAGFKIHAHWMSNLLGSSPNEDIKDYKKIFLDERFKPDEIKIYPCSLISNTKLYDHYKSGTWKPYNEKQILNILTKCISSTPRYCRITRIIRDISSEDIVSGNKKSNFRQIAENELKNNNIEIEEIRYREIKDEPIDIKNLVLKITQYKTIQSEEYFIEYVTKNDKIVAFLRLSLPCNTSDHFIKELKGSAIIREIHVYGQTVNIGKEEIGMAQHLGLGKKLMRIAIDISRKNKYPRLSVISSVGTRQYYRKNGFTDGDLYQHINLN